jgi:4-hydroxy-2-oxoheptanedioate aldolase
MGIPTFGTWTKLQGAEPVELMALAGFDFVIADLEHSPLSLSDVATQVVAAHSRGIPMYVRVQPGIDASCGRLLDAGLDGIVFPHVSSSAAAERAIRPTLFEPHGTRGFGSTSRAGSWGMTAPDAYLVADHVRRIVMIEDRPGVDAIAEIARVPKVDAILVGPADLAVACGHPGAPQHPDVRATIATIARNAQAAGIPCGIAVPSPDEVSEARALGFSFFIVGNDATILGRAAQSIVAALAKPPQ